MNCSDHTCGGVCLENQFCIGFEMFCLVRIILMCQAVMLLLSVVVAVVVEEFRQKLIE